MEKRDGKKVFIISIIVIIILVLIIIFSIVKPEQAENIWSRLRGELRGELATLRGEISTDVIRDVTNLGGGRYSVTLITPTAPLSDDEVIMIAEQVPQGIAVVEGSWSVEPAYYYGSILVWLFTNSGETQRVGRQEVTQQIPNTISYRVSGSSNDEFRGKWSLKVNWTEEEEIAGENILP